MINRQISPPVVSLVTNIRSIHEIACRGIACYVWLALSQPLHLDNRGHSLFLPLARGRWPKARGGVGGLSRMHIHRRQAAPPASTVNSRRESDGSPSPHRRPDRATWISGSRESPCARLHDAAESDGSPCRRPLAGKAGKLNTIRLFPGKALGGFPAPVDRRRCCFCAQIQGRPSARSLRRMLFTAFARAALGTGSHHRGTRRGRSFPTTSRRGARQVHAARDVFFTTLSARTPVPTREPP